MIRLAQGKKPLKDEEMPDDMMPLDGGDGNGDMYGQFMSNAGGGLAGGGGGFGGMGRKDPFKAIQMYNENAFKNWDQNILEQCPNCNRTFRPEAMEHHKRACTADKPLKPLRKDEGGQTLIHKSKSPNLGLAARTAAAEKQGRFADTEFSPGRDRSQNRSSQPKQFQTRAGMPNEQRGRHNLDKSNPGATRNASIDVQMAKRGYGSPRTNNNMEAENLDDMY